jgi:hypothetical protein
MYNQTAAGGQPEKFLFILTRFFLFYFKFLLFFEKQLEKSRKKKGVGVGMECAYTALPFPVFRLPRQLSVISSLGKVENEGPQNPPQTLTSLAFFPLKRPVKGRAENDSLEH